MVWFPVRCIGAVLPGEDGSCGEDVLGVSELPLNSSYHTSAISDTCAFPEPSKRQPAMTVPAGGGHAVVCGSDRVAVVRFTGGPAARPLTLLDTDVAAAVGADTFALAAAAAYGQDEVLVFGLAVSVAGDMNLVAARVALLRDGFGVVKASAGFGPPQSVTPPLCVVALAVPRRPPADGVTAAVTMGALVYVAAGNASHSCSRDDGPSGGLAYDSDLGLWWVDTKENEITYSFARREQLESGSCVRVVWAPRTDQSDPGRPEVLVDEASGHLLVITATGSVVPVPYVVDAGGTPTGELRTPAVARRPQITSDESGRVYSIRGAALAGAADASALTDERTVALATRNPGLLLAFTMPFVPLCAQSMEAGGCPRPPAQSVFVWATLPPCAPGSSLRFATGLCDPVPAGYFSWTTGVTESCPVGPDRVPVHANDVNCASPTPCPAGTHGLYTGAVGFEACALCENCTHNPLPGVADACVPCAAGESCPVGAVLPLPARALVPGTLRGAPVQADDAFSASMDGDLAASLAVDRASLDRTSRAILVAGAATAAVAALLYAVVGPRRRAHLAVVDVFSKRHYTPVHTPVYRRPRALGGMAAILAAVAALTVFGLLLNGYANDNVTVSRQVAPDVGTASRAKLHAEVDLAVRLELWGGAMTSIFHGIDQAGDSCELAVLTSSLPSGAGATKRCVNGSGSYMELEFGCRGCTLAAEARVSATLSRMAYVHSVRVTVETRDAKNPDRRSAIAAVVDSRLLPAPGKDNGAGGGSLVVIRGIEMTLDVFPTELLRQDTGATEHVPGIDLATVRVDNMLSAAPVVAVPSELEDDEVGGWRSRSSPDTISLHLAPVPQVVRTDISNRQSPSEFLAALLGAMVGVVAAAGIAMQGIEHASRWLHGSTVGAKEHARKRQEHCHGRPETSGEAGAMEMRYEPLLGDAGPGDGGDRP